MTDIKKKASLPSSMTPPGLISINDSIDDVAQKALEAAERAEKLEASKRKAGGRKGKAVKAAT